MRNDHDNSGSHGNVPASNPDLLAQMGYETRDIALNSLTRWFGFLILFVIFMTAVAFVTYKVFVPSFVEAEKVSPLAHVNAVPPFPQIQADPHQDIHQYRQAEDQILDGKAAMVGQPLGAPIHEAIDVMSEQNGIAGITGDDNTPLVGMAYPGSGDYKKTPEKPASGDGSATETSSAPAGVMPTPGAANTENGAP